MLAFPTKKSRGQMLIVIMIALIGLAGVAGLVIDGGNTLLDRRSAQNAADSAALAGGIVRVNQPNGDWVGAIMASAAENGYPNDGVKSTVDVYSPPKSGPYTNNIEYVQVIITSHVKMYFANIIGRRESVNVVETIVRTKPAQVKPLLGEAAMASLAPTSECDKERAFWIYEAGTFEVIGGHVFINSSNPTCALYQEGGGSIYMKYNDPIMVVGGVHIENPRRISPVVQVGAAQIKYPPPFIMPEIDCKKEATLSEDGEIMTPGSWRGNFPPVGLRELKPGVYCLENGFITHKDTEIDGGNVVIKVEKGEVRIDDNAIVRLSAPAEGPYAGLLLFLPLDNNKRVWLNQNPQSDFTGTILAPASNIFFKGSESRYGFHSQIIGYRISLSGDTKIPIVYDPDENYKALSNSELQLIK